jgi:hypothetical protein
MDTKAIQMHHLYDKNNEVIGKTMFSMDEDESHGTQKFFYLAGPILDTLERGKYGGVIPYLTLQNCVADAACEKEKTGETQPY